MTDNLIIRTPNGDFDLFGNEDIVQTMSIFDLSDITKRTGEYTNALKFPLTNNNIRLIEYADEMTTINTVPYKKVSAQIIVGGLVIRNGFISIPSVSDVIEGRFYSGNTVYYDLIKNLYLGDLDWSAYDHIWNYANAVASSANTSGYLYPVMDYGGQTLGGDIVDVRKILPATFNKTILRLMIEQLGYTYVDDFARDDFNSSVLPYSKKNPQVSTEIQLLNSVDVGNTNNYSLFIPSRIYVTNQTLGITPTFPQYFNLPIYTPTEYNLINTPGSSTNYNLVTKKFTAQYAGNYDYDYLCELVSYDYMTFTPSFPLVNYLVSTSTLLVVKKITASGSSVINTVYCCTGYDNPTGSGSYPVIPPITQTYLTNNITGSVYLNVGEQLEFSIQTYYRLSPHYLGSSLVNIAVDFDPQVKDTAYLTIDLQPTLVFGGLITYSAMLPKIKCSDFLKDMAVRFGIILAVDDDTKTITATNIQRISDNTPDAIDLSDLLDETDPPEQQFSLNSYAQNNNFKHAEDKSILSTPDGTDYNLVINNANLELSKDLYKSPFAPSENVDFNSVITTSINLYNINTSKFENDVVSRICFSEPVFSMFKFTDGTTTSGYINTRRIWFIDDTIPEQGMGFGSNLIPKNSATLIDILQNLRLVKANFNLSIIHIKNFNPLLPVYVRQFQSYFILSNINQFNYTKPGLTELELIKLN